MPRLSKKFGSRLLPAFSPIKPIRFHLYLLPLLLLILATAIFFHQITFSGQVLYFGDNLALKLPSAIYGWNRIVHGQLPLWNPHLFTGMPYLADISNAIFYPLSLIYLIFPPFQALTYQTLISIVLAGFFTYFYCHLLHLNRSASLAAAISFMLSSTLIHYTNYANLLGSSIWLPLTLLCLHQSFTSPRRYWWLLTSFALDLQITAGHPQPVYYTVLIITGYTLFLFLRSKLLTRLTLIFSILITSFGLTALVLLPAQELTRLSTRSQINYQAATLDSLHPALLIRLLLPDFFDQPQLGMAWGPAWRHVSDNQGYLGIISLVIIFIGWLHISTSLYRRYFYFFLIASLLALILALGKYTPLYHLWFNYLPGLNHFRGPAESLLIFNFSTAILTGISLDSISKLHFHSPFNIKLLSIISLLILLVLICLDFSFHALWRPIGNFHTLARDQVIFTSIAVDILFALAGSLLTLVFIHRRQFSFIILLIFIDLYFHNSTQIFTLSPQILSFPSPSAQHLHRLMTPQDRFISYQDIQPYTGLGNYWENITLRPPFADSYFTPHEQQSASILNSRLNDLASDWHLPYKLSSPYGYSSFLLTNYLNYLNNTESVLPQNSPPSASFTPTKLDDLAVRFLLTSSSITTRNSAHPRARIVSATNQIVPAQILVDHPEHVIIFAQVLSPSQLVLMDSLYPGWQAFIDDQPATIIPYQQAFRSLNLSPGSHQIEFTFRPLSWYLGSLISLITLLTIIIYSWIIRDDFKSLLSHRS